MRNHLNNKKGNVLIVSYAIIALLLLFGGSFLMRAFSEITAARVFEHSTKALWAAEVAIADALWRVENQLSLPLPQDAAALALDKQNKIFGWIDSIEGQTPESLTLIAKGSATSGPGDQPIERDLKVKFQNLAYKGALNTKGDIELNGMGHIKVDGSVVASGQVVRDANFIKLGGTFEVIGKNKVIMGAPDYATTVIGPDLDSDGVVSRADFETYYSQQAEKKRLVDPAGIVIIKPPSGTPSITIEPDKLAPGENIIYVERHEDDASGALLVKLAGTVDRDILVVSNAKVYNTIVDSNVPNTEPKPKIAIYSFESIGQETNPLQTADYEVLLVSYGGKVGFYKHPNWITYYGYPTDSKLEATVIAEKGIIFQMGLFPDDKFEVAPSPYYTREETPYIYEPIDLASLGAFGIEFDADAADAGANGDSSGAFTERREEGYRWSMGSWKEDHTSQGDVVN